MPSTALQPKTLQELVAEAKANIAEVDVAALKQRQANEPNLLIIDVREPDEWQVGTIPNAKTLSRGVLEFQIEQITADRSAPIVCYCAGGNRSALAAQSLQQIGYTNVTSLQGGWRAWSCKY